MPVNADKKRIIQSILSVFETGKTEPDYGALVILDDGAGITYGKHQSTDRSGSLDQIVLRYIDRGGLFASALTPYVSKLAGNETVGADPKNPSSWPSWLKELTDLLRRAGSDPVMQKAQDDIFDEVYWTSAAAQAKDMKLVLPLSWLICYDSTIHSGSNGIARIRKMFPESPPSGGGDERDWAVAYLQARRSWLASHEKAILRDTVYRIDAILKMAEDGNWNLDTPIVIAKPRATVT